MNLKNYTSTIAPEKSIQLIESYLVQAGATDISKKYKDGVCCAITFRLMVDNMPIFFQLPAKVDSAYAIMMKGRTRSGQSNIKAAKQQAEKTAWKIVCDWVQIQLSMIQLKQADPMQIFLPYAYDPRNDETFYDKIKNNNFKLLTNGNS